MDFFKSTKLQYYTIHIWLKPLMHTEQFIWRIDDKYMRIFHCTEGQLSNLYIVQGSNLFLNLLYCLPLPTSSGKENPCQCKRCRRWGFNPWVEKIPWKRAWQPILVFLPRESHGQRSLAAAVHKSKKNQTLLKQLSIAQR